MKMWKINPIAKLFKSSLIKLPSPSNISSWWNFGSLLGMCLMIQIISGLFIAFHYSNDIFLAFESISHLSRNVNFGWLMRAIHSNGASLFFICIYMHIGRGMYYASYMYKHVWMSGIMILFLTMATAFLGYVLPWGQMSFWGATVITNLLSAIPYLGMMIVQWIWGGFAINNATLSRFFSIHFILPFILTALVMIHLMLLHQTGSNNPLGTNSNIDKIPFNPYFSIKDIFGLLFLLALFSLFILIHPYKLNDPDNFMPANSMVTPVHIQPEWYFLFAYAILRSIPNKLGGVLAMMASILILVILPIMKKKIQSNSFYVINKTMFWIFVAMLMILTWIGAKPAEEPFILLGQILTISYFLFFLIQFPMIKMWEKIILE